MERQGENISKIKDRLFKLSNLFLQRGEKGKVAEKKDLRQQNQTSNIYIDKNDAIFKLEGRAFRGPFGSL